MATNFPSSLDTSTTIPAEGASTVLSTNHVTAHQNIQDAIEVIEAKIGVDSSAVTTSHDYKLSGVTGSDKAVSKTGSEVLTNKTLTAPVVNVGSDATGDMYYRNAGVLTRIAVGTDNQILKLNGTTPNWEAETVTVNADQTTAGIVEEATAAEITAGTATGGTGASLYVSPDQLAASTPVFNGSGLTNLPVVVYNTTASDNLKLSADTERAQASGFSGLTYVLVKSFQVQFNGGIRVKVEQKNPSGAGSGDVRIYKNGVYQSITHNGGATYTAYSDDLSDVGAGDYIQLYCAKEDGSTTTIRNARICYDRVSNILGTVVTD